MIDPKLVTEALTDLRGAIERAQEPTRDYKKTSGHVYRPDAARFKLVVWFKNGNTRYFRSYDTKRFKDKTLIDEWQGLMKLIKFANELNGQYKNAIIYGTCEPEKNFFKSNYNIEIVKWDMYGNQKENKFVTFQNDNENVIVNTKQIQYTNKFKI